jgi:hypothetical protein
VSDIDQHQSNEIGGPPTNESFRPLRTTSVRARLPPVWRADGAIGKAIETEAFPMLIAECQ